MRFIRFSRSGIAPLLCLLTGLGIAASGTAGRDFAGFYRLGEVLKTGSQRSVAITVRIGNYGDKDLAAGRVVLKCATDPARNCAAFEAVSIQRGEFCKRTGRFTVAPEDVRHWLQSAPLFVMEDRDSAGHPRQRRIEMMQVEMGVK